MKEISKNLKQLDIDFHYSLRVNYHYLAIPFRILLYDEMERNIFFYNNFNFLETNT